MASHSGSSCGTVEETIDALRSARPTPRSSSRLRSAAPSSSAVESRTVAKRQCSTSVPSSHVPKWVWVLPTSTVNSMAWEYGGMPAKLYVVHGSHPCGALKVALALKGIAYKVVEYPPPFHMPIQRMRFGRRTVPGIRFEDGEKLSGSSPILKRLDVLAPQPAMYPDARVEEAESWGESVLQPMARRLIWWGLSHDHAAIHGFQAGGKLPPLPKPVVLALAPLIARIESRANDVSDDAVRADLAALPGHLDRVDGLMADGVIGADEPNAADLQ